MKMNLNYLSVLRELSNLCVGEGGMCDGPLQGFDLHVMNLHLLLVGHDFRLKLSKGLFKFHIWCCHSGCQQAIWIMNYM